MNSVSRPIVAVCASAILVVGMAEAARWISGAFMSSGVQVAPAARVTPEVKAPVGVSVAEAASVPTIDSTGLDDATIAARGDTTGKQLPPELGPPTMEGAGSQRTDSRNDRSMKMPLLRNTL